MGIGRTIAISLILHTATIVVIFSINYRERVFPLPKDYMLVSLIEKLSENRLFEITQSNNRRNPEHGKRSKKQYSLPSDMSVTSQEILRLYLRMTEDKVITGGVGTEIKEKGKNDVALTLPSDSNANENNGGFFNEPATRTEKGGNGVHGIVGTEVSEGITTGQDIEFFGVKGQLKDGSNSSVFEAIRSAIEKAKVYPLLARKEGMEGMVQVSFTIDEKGLPQDIRILKSSGYRILDEEVKKMLKKASPFPGIKGEIIIPITFKLTESISNRQ